MPRQSYLSVKGEFFCETAAERSRFIGHCKSIACEEEALGEIAGARKRHPQATHICYAYVLEPFCGTMRFSDDGEPSHTAGMPILDAIRLKKLSYTLVTVTRYFGGIKLGTGGLVRAYGDCAARAIEGCGVTEYVFSQKFRIEASYPDYSACEKFIYSECRVLDIKYSDNVAITAVCGSLGFDSFSAKISDMTGGRVKAEIIETLYFPFEN